MRKNGWIVIAGRRGEGAGTLPSSGEMLAGSPRHSLLLEEKDAGGGEKKTEIFVKKKERGERHVWANQGVWEWKGM